MTKKSILQNIFIGLIFVCAAASATFAQTTVFTYQGKLTDSGTPQTSYQMEFKLFGSPGGTDQIGSTITNPSVSVTQGVFTVNLDFGAAAFPGADRYLQISVRRSSAESFVTLNPRQQITSSPYSIRTLSAAQADVALDSNKLGGVDASEYVTTTSVGNSFIKNATTQQTGNFNISGNGIIGGNVGIGSTNPESGYRLDVSGAGVFRTGNGRINFASPSGETGMAIISNSPNNRADIRFDGTTLKLNAALGTTAPCCGIAINTAGNVGIGTTTPSLFSGGTGRFVSISDSVNPGLALTNTGAGGKQFFLYSAGGGGFRVFDATSSADRLTINTGGNVGIGTTTPVHRLSLIGGPSWTSNFFTGALELGNASAIGWQPNAAGNRFGIGQTTGGLTFFNTLSNPGTTGSPANYVMVINDNGNITQPINNNGLVKAMIETDEIGSIIRCFNAITNSSDSASDCGFTNTSPSQGVTRINFGFPVAGRFVSVTPRFDSSFDDSNSNIGANYRFLNSTTIEVFTFISGNSNGLDYAAFTLILY